MKLILFTLCSVIALIFPQSSSAHGAGSSPSFKIDGVIAEPYSLQKAGISYSPLTIPQDIAAKNYLPKESIEFEIDMKALETEFAPEVMDTLKFIWDFGDGSKGTGIKNTHQYTKIGSHVLTIHADYGDSNAEPLLIESTLINVVPESSYQLPRAIIAINGKQGKKENYNTLDFDFNKSLTFKPIPSKTSSKVATYSWDFGDEKTSNKANTSHQYQLPQAFTTVILRVTDEKGFFTDSYVNLRNVGSNKPQDKFNLFKKGVPLVGIAAAIAISGIIIFLITRRKKK